MTRYLSLSDLPAQVGREVGCSDWVDVDQARIDLFAQATGDWQWIHCDPVRAAAEGPYGTTVAHGLLSLSLLPQMLGAAVQIEDAGLAINYGLNRVRFPAPVPAGSRLQGRFTLLACEALPDGAQLSLLVTMVREGGAKPVCVAESLIRYYRQTPHFSS
jgi:acyl dehydratase